MRCTEVDPKTHSYIDPSIYYVGYTQQSDMQEVTAPSHPGCLQQNNLPTDPRVPQIL